MASSGGSVKGAKRERVVEVIGRGTEEGLNWVLDAVLEREGDRGGGGGGSGGGRGCLIVAEALRAITIFGLPPLLCGTVEEAAR